MKEFVGRETLRVMSRTNVLLTVVVAILMIPLSGCVSGGVSGADGAQGEQGRHHWILHRSLCIDLIDY